MTKSRSKISRLSVPIVTAACLTLSLAHAQQSKIDSDILADPDPKKSHSVFVEASKQLLRGPDGYRKFCEQNAGSKRSDLRKRTIDRLRALAELSHKGLEGELKALFDDDSIRRVERTWIVNGFFCRATLAACRSLAESEEVAFVHRQRVLPQRNPRASQALDAKRATHRELAIDTTSNLSAQDLKALDRPWNLDRIRAPEAWPMATGHGVVIALIDTGLTPARPLLDALWKNPREVFDGEDNDGNGLRDDVHGFDFSEQNGFVLSDPHGHGSACATIAAGRPALGRAFGVAPNARLMILKGGGRLHSYEYALENGADIVSMSYMWVRTKLGGYRSLYRLAHEHMTAAGILSVGGAGNFAKTAEAGKQIALPKDIPCVLAAAGIVESGELAAASSRGPVTWSGVRNYDDYHAAAPLEKPDVTACFGGFPVWWPAGKELRKRWKQISKIDGAQLILGPRGNSFSGPHVAGVLAMMLEVAPELPAWRFQSILRATCKDLGEAGFDTGFGAGLVQADAAVKAAIAAAKVHAAK